MKHFYFKTAVTLLCLSFGILSSYLPAPLSSFREILNAYPLFSINTQNSPVDKNVEIQFQELFAYYKGRSAKFVVENHTTESLHYESYGKNNHCSYTFSYKIGEVEQILKPSVCFSPGLKEQELLPGETATYLIDIPTEAYDAVKVKTAFEFEIGKKRHKQIVWSGDAMLPRIEFPESPVKE